MDNLASPDFPAYWCYLVVIIVGMLVATATLNRLLADQPGYWAFLNTWLLFIVHAALPVAVFWFLDYTTAVKDTSLFAALVVAVAYQQIFAGGVQGIVMPGQTSRLWKPFEAWVQAIAKRIAVSSKRAGDKFEAGVRNFIAADAEKIERLHAVASEYSQAGSKLQADLKAISDEEAPTGLNHEEFGAIKDRRKVRRLVDELRASIPERFGDVLREKNLVSRWDYWRWFRRLKSRAMASLAIGLLVIGGAFVFNWFFADATQLSYHQWRFLKTNTSDADRFRSREFFGARLQKLSAENSGQVDENVAATLGAITARLRYKDLAAQSCEDIGRLLVDFHSPAVDRFVIPQLIEALKNENSDIRLHICETLKALHDADYEKFALPESIIQWVPKKGDSPSDIASYVRMWTDWWKSAPH